MEKILNFGSLNIDYVYRVPHFVRPGETLASVSLEKVPGGKGLNQSVALAKAGCRVYHAGKIGADGEMLLDVLQKSGADVTYTQTDGSVSGHAIIQVDDNGQNCILLHGGANQEITPADVDAVLAQFAAGDYLLLQNEISSLPYIVKRAQEKGLRIVLNPSPIGPVLKELDLRALELLLVNETEGKELTGKTEPEEILAAFAQMLPQVKVVLTLGSDGAWYQDAKQRYFQPAFAVKAVDTTAAGDTFTGFFLYGLTAGLSIPETMRLAAKASSVSVTRKGASVSVPTLQEVLGAL